MKILKDQIFDTQGLIGKTIKNIPYPIDKDSMFILFTDDSYCVIEIYEDYDNQELIAISKTPFSTNPDDYNGGSIYNLYKAELIDQEELNRLLEIKRPIDIENFKQRELKQLAELKKKYESE